jgi:chromosomal replication initiator protein
MDFTMTTTTTAPLPPTTPWEQILLKMEKRVGDSNFSTWFRPTRQEAASNGTIVVRVPGPPFRKQLTERFRIYLDAVMADLGMADTQLEFICEKDDPPAAPKHPHATPAKLAQTKLDFESVENQLNPRYTFDSFVVGGSNQFAHAASRAVAEAPPSKAYNPLYLYGGVGMGKTHLMQAIGHLIKAKNPALRLTFISAEKFTNEVINSLRFDRMVSFRDRFRSVDVLMVDDIEFIAGKERTQEEFFHTFNTLYELQKQIVLSSDCPPKEIAAIEERLRSRFEWGLIADIQPPDLETKIAILQKKAESERFQLPGEVAEFIARSIKSNVRELEGALTRIMAYSSLTGTPVNLGMAHQALRDIIATQEKKVTIELIQKRVGEQFGLREQDLKVRSNSKAIAYPRQIAMYLVKQLTHASLPEIGRQFGGKHHTTVLHSINKIETLRQTDKDLNRTLSRLLDSLA